MALPLARVIFGRLVLARGALRSPGAAARERSGKGQSAGGLRPARQGRLEDVQKVLLRQRGGWRVWLSLS